MQNQNLLTQEFSKAQMPKPGNIFSLNNLLYLAAAVGTGAIMFELYSIWTFKLGMTVIATFGIISWVIARQVLAIKEQMTLLKQQEVQNSDVRFQAMVENSSDMITIR